MTSARSDGTQLSTSLEGQHRQALDREGDIDQLVPKVEKAMQAYQICKDRLMKVQETLGQYFEKDSDEGDGVVE